MIHIRDYNLEDELEWLDVHASVMVDSYAWWTAIHKKPEYENDIVDLVAICDDRIVGFITIEINSQVLKELDNYGFVWEFGVHRDYRGNGIGLKLIKKAHKILNEKYKIDKTIWYSQDENAKKYYEHIGMKEIDRHWQFSIVPDDKLKKEFKNNGFDCWEIRGSCSIDDFDKVKKKYNVIEDDDPINPKICIGYELVL
ncbi:MAG: GNAT family N-acetyltransferase [Firmicutes bacterium]|nr:GNAT family N-acetyltransferase [Bacillota bacterium]